MNVLNKYLQSHYKKTNITIKKIIGIIVVVLAFIGSWFYWQSYKNGLFEKEIVDIGKPMESVKGAYQGILDNTQKSGYDLTVEGISLIEKGKTDLGIMALEKATTKDNNYRDSYIFAGVAHTKLAKEKNDQFELKKALYYLEKAKDLDPIYPLTYEILADVYARLGDAENATLCYNKYKDFAVEK